MTKHRGPTPAKPWGKWQPTKTVRNTLSGAQATLGDDEICWLNNLYTVVGRRLAGGDNAPAMIWLSIRRNDRKPARDWRHLQRIKNELVGPECEGMEMFPADSRLVDQANQTHLWVVLDPSFQWPWGFSERVVKDHDDEEVVTLGAVQRPFEIDPAQAEAEVRALIKNTVVDVPLDMPEVGHCDRCGDPCDVCEADR